MTQNERSKRIEQSFNHALKCVKERVEAFKEASKIYGIKYESLERICDDGHLFEQYKYKKNKNDEQKK